MADRSLQHQDMLEAVQNHTPEVLVIDEIGSQDAIEAACRIGFKGIALVATAHANNLKEAIGNVALQSLFGGFQTSAESDQTAQRWSSAAVHLSSRAWSNLAVDPTTSGWEGAIDLILARKPAKGCKSACAQHPHADLEAAGAHVPSSQGRRDGGAEAPRS